LPLVCLGPRISYMEFYRGYGRKEGRDFQN